MPYIQQIPFQSRKLIANNVFESSLAPRIFLPQPTFNGLFVMYNFRVSDKDFSCGLFTFNSVKFLWALHCTFVLEILKPRKPHTNVSMPKSDNVDDDKRTENNQRKSRYFATSSLRFDVWETSAEISYWWCIRGLGSATGWLCHVWDLLQIVRSTTQARSGKWSVWNFFRRCSDVILGGNQWWRHEMSAVFSGKSGNKDATETAHA